MEMQAVTLFATCGEQSQDVFLKVITLSKKWLTCIIDYCQTSLGVSSLLLATQIVREMTTTVDEQLAACAPLF